MIIKTNDKRKSRQFMVSCYNQDLNWLGEYAESVVLYDRSDFPQIGSVIVPNLGTDIADKLHYIIANYKNLPEVCIFTKANLFKYISKEEFDRVIDNQEFTPLLKMNHKTYSRDGQEICFYMNGIYWEINNLWYLNEHPVKYDPKEIQKLMGIDTFDYLPFAPGSNYILTKKNILKHPVEFYIKLYNYLMWAVYPGEAQIIERGLYTIWHP